MAPALLLIGGTLCDDALWAPLLDVAPPLAECIHVADYRRHESAREAAADLLERYPGRLVPVGFSLGGFVAQEMAALAPERLSGLVLVATNARADAPGGAQARQRMMDLAGTLGLGAAIRQQLWPAYVAPGRLSDGPLQDAIVAMAERLGPEVFRRQAAIAATRADGLARLSAWRGPALVVSGGQDALNPEDRQLEMRVRMRQGRWVSLQNVGHFVPLEAPAGLHCILREWLRDYVFPRPASSRHRMTLEPATQDERNPASHGRNPGR